MSAETDDPFERVWLNASATVAHATKRCAGTATEPIPSFAAFVDDEDRCGTCMPGSVVNPSVPEDVPVGEELREIRNQLGLTQADVANRVGLDQYRPVSHWETGNHKPSHVFHDALRDLSDEAERLEEHDDHGQEEIDDVVCQSCGRSFANVQALAGHQSGNPECQCGTCAEIGTGTPEWYIHRTEDHGIPMSALDYLEPGEFEAIVADAETLVDVCEELGWEMHRVARVLNAYGLADAVGRGKEERPDGDDNWQALYNGAGGASS